jgi:dTDP-4-amino-4,6-dideoxygalactose transaminase
MMVYVSDLAIFSGKPAFSAPLHVGRPNIGDRAVLLQRIENMLDQHWLTNDGPYVQELEKRIAEMIGVKHCVALCNGTISLEIVIRGVGLSGEVIVPSFSFIATAHALQWQEITPVFCDIDPNTHNLDPDRVEAMITPRTTGIIGVHVWGRPCNVEALREIAVRHRLSLMFDAAHAFGCAYPDGEMIGTKGDAEVFSFHATKFFNTFEGGALTTNNDELAAKTRLMRNFGFAQYDKVDYLGTNGKMSEVAAAMGLTGLESLEGFIAGNRRNYNCYRTKLADIPGLKIITYDETVPQNYQYIVLEIDEELAGLSRDELVSILWAENVLARRYFYPGCHKMEPYRSYFPHAGLLLPETERLAQKVLLLPTGTSIDEQTIHTVCQLIRFSLAHSQEIKQRLATKEVAFGL